MVARPKLASLAARRNRKYKRDKDGRFATTSGADAAEHRRNPEGQHRAANARPVQTPPTEAEARAAHARLRTIFGNRLHVRDTDNPRVRQHLVDLDRLPEAHKKRLARHARGVTGGGIYLSGQGNVLDVANRDDLRAAYGDDPLVKQAAGLTSYPHRTVMIGVRTSMSVSTAQHESGHLLDQALGIPSLDNRYPFRSIIERARRDGFLAPYFTQPGGIGVRESFAEGYALWNQYRDAPDRNLQIATRLGAPARSGRDRAEAERMGRQIAEFFDTLV